MQRCLRKRCDELAHLIRRSERVASAVEEQHRCGHVRQVRVAPFCGLVWWMQGIAEKEERGRRWHEPAASGDLRCDAAPHGLATRDHRAVAPAGGLLPDLFEMRFEYGRPIG